MLSCTPLSLRGRDHPREYGENRAGYKVHVGGQGSSPRIRGKSRGNEFTQLFHGIIPANTGKIIEEFEARLPRPDHPREYGENRLSRGGIVSGLGSSPRIRGK